MALTPLEVEVLDGGAPVDGATIEVRNHLRASAGPLSPTGYDDQGAALSDPVLTDSTGGVSGGIWLPNGLYDWRWSFGGFTSGWRSFPAYRGRGREFYDELTPAAALPATDTVVVSSGGVDDAVGVARVSLTFDHDHMGDVVIMLVPPWEATSDLTAVGPPTSATSGGSPLSGAEVELRDAVTLAPLVLYDDATGATPLGTPYLTNVNGNLLDGFHHAVLYQSRVPTSDNLTNWGAVQIAEGPGVVLWNGPANVGFGMSDFAFDGTVTFAAAGQDNSSAFADGDTLGAGGLASALSGFSSTGTWTLWIAGGTAGSPGELAAWTFELLSV
jgi:hypothetical protein